MHLFVIVCLLVLTTSVASTQCNSSKIYPLFVGSTLSNTTGVSFSGIAGGHSARVAVDGIASLSTQTANPKVDMFLESLRGKGHTSPAGHVFLPVKISSPLSDDPDRILISSQFTTLVAHSILLERMKRRACECRWEVNVSLNGEESRKLCRLSLSSFLLLRLSKYYFHSQGCERALWHRKDPQPGRRAGRFYILCVAESLPQNNQRRHKTLAGILCIWFRRYKFPVKVLMCVIYYDNSTPFVHITIFTQWQFVYPQFLITSTKIQSKHQQENNSKTLSSDQIRCMNKRAGEAVRVHWTERWIQRHTTYRNHISSPTYLTYIKTILHCVLKRSVKPIKRFEFFEKITE